MENLEIAAQYAIVTFELKKAQAEVDRITKVKETWQGLYNDCEAEIAELEERLVLHDTSLQRNASEIAELKAFAKYLHENAQTVWDEGLTLEKEFSLFKHTTLEKGDG